MTIVPEEQVTMIDYLRYFEKDSYHPFSKQK